MPIETQYLFFFSMIGSFNGFLLAVYFWFGKPRDSANKFLALMLLMLSLRIFKSVILYFNPDSAKSLLQLGLSACFLIGPFLYFHTLSLFDKFTWRNQWHKGQILLLVGIVFGIGFSFPYGTYQELWAGPFYRIINFVWLGYIIATAWELKPLWQKWNAKNRAFLRKEIITLSVFIGNCLIWLAFFSANYFSYILGAIIFSFILYLSLLLLVFHRQERPSKYVNKNILADEALSLKTQLDSLMETEKLHLSPTITLPKLAAQLNIGTPKLSQFLNDNLGQSFTDFINEHRIESAKLRLHSEGKSIKLEQLAEECGYNSMSTFYSSFKKFTGVTPARYRDSLS